MFFFCLGDSWLFKRSILVSLFVANFRKVLKHFLILNTGESVSTALIKNRFILHFNHPYGFWSLSPLSQLELFKVVVFGKFCFDFIKLSLFCLIYFFFLLLLFISFWSLPVSGKFPTKKIAPPPLPVRIRVWVRTVFTGAKKGDFWQFCAKLHLFVETR